MTGALIGTVKDEQGGALAGARVRVSSPALIGGQRTLPTNEKGQLRFPALPPGRYVLDIEFEGFTTYHEADIRIGAGGTIEVTPVLKLAGVADSVVVEGAGSRIEARDPGFGTRFGAEDFDAIPMRRFSSYDLSVAYIRKDGRDFIGWKEVAGLYQAQPVTLTDGPGRVVQVLRLISPASARRFRLTNPEDYSLTCRALSKADASASVNAMSAF